MHKSDLMWLCIRTNIVTYLFSVTGLQIFLEFLSLSFKILLLLLQLGQLVLDGRQRHLNVLHFVLYFDDGFLLRPHDRRVLQHAGFHVMKVVLLAQGLGDEHDRHGHTQAGHDNGDLHRG